MLEFLMLKCVEKVLPNEYKKALKLTHSNLINLLFNSDNINKDMKNVLVAINKMRNNIAHEIVYKPSYTEYKKFYFWLKKHQLILQMVLFNHWKKWKIKQV